jgi:hypothetical protein
LPLKVTPQFFSGNLQIYRTSKDLFIRNKDELVVVPGGGVNLQTQLDVMQVLARKGKATLSFVGSGTYGRNVKESRDSFYQSKEFKTVDAKLQWKAPFKETKGGISIGAGYQLQTNTMLNGFKATEFENLDQYLRMPTGQSGYVAIGIKL